MLYTFSRRACISAIINIDIFKENICTGIIQRTIMINRGNMLIKMFIVMHISKIHAKK